MKTGQWFVYLLICADDSVYTGITNNLDKRLKKHVKGKGSKYVRSRLPFYLFKFFIVNSKSEALKLEIKLKKMKRKDKLLYDHN